MPSSSYQLVTPCVNPNIIFLTLFIQIIINNDDSNNSSKTNNLSHSSSLRCLDVDWMSLCESNFLFNFQKEKINVTFSPKGPKDMSTERVWE